MLQDRQLLDGMMRMLIRGCATSSHVPSWSCYHQRRQSFAQSSRGASGVRPQAGSDERVAAGAVCGISEAVTVTGLIVEDNGGFLAVTLASNRHTLSGGHLLDISAATQPQRYVPSQPCAT